MEVTQGIQNLENGMPLVAERMTVVRVYVRTESDEASLADVSAGLGGWRGNQFLGVVWPENGPITARPDGGERLNLDDSLWFVLPFDWIQPGELMLKALVFRGSPQSVEHEADPDDNLIAETVSFTAVDPIAVRLVHVHLHQEPDPNAPELTYLFQEHTVEVAKILLSLLRFLPVSDVFWDASIQSDLEVESPLGGVGTIPGTGTLVFPAGHSDGEEWDLADVKDRNALTATIAWVRTWTDPNKQQMFYGMVDPSIDMGGYWGWATHGVAFGHMTTDVRNDAPWNVVGGITIAHELAHNLGLNHALCEGSEGPPNGTIDIGYPYPYSDCRLAGPDPAGYYGLDVYWWIWPENVSQPTVIGNDPDGPTGQVAFPLMGYRAPWWTDPYAYCLLLQALGVPCSPASLNLALPGTLGGAVATLPLIAWNARARTEPATFALVAATLDPDGAAASIDAFLPVPSPPVAAVDEAEARSRAIAAAGGPFAVRFEDSGGRELGLQPLASLDPRPHHGRVADADQVIELLRLPPGTARVVLLFRGREVDARVASANPPTVTFERPTGGGDLAGPVELAWRADDPDGDDLSFTLFYSTDDGATWEVLAAGLGVTTAKLSSLNGIPSTEALRFRVVASDGFHAAEAVTADRYRIGNSPPFPVIVAPADGSTFRAGETVVFGAAALDAEDGALRGDALRWRSDRDGELGTGERLDVRTLSPGRHTVTLSVRDAAGAEATASITITVSAEGAVLLPDAEAERTLRRAFGESEEGWFAGLRWYALGALVVLLLAGGAAWLSRPRFGPRKRLS